MNLDLHKEFYLFEWHRKEQLAAESNAPIALLTVLAGAVLYLVRTFPYSDNGYTVPFVALTAVGIAGQVAGIYFVIRSLLPDWSEQIASPDKLQDYYEELVEFYRVNSGSPEDAQSAFDAYLQARMAEATVSNRRNNTITAGALYNTIRCIVFSLIFAGLSLVPYLPESLNAKPEVTMVHLDDRVEVRAEVSQMPDDDSPGHPQPIPQPTQQPEPPPPGPPNEEVRKDGQTREKR